MPNARQFVNRDLVEINVPENAVLPEGWGWGAFFSGSTWYGVHDDGRTVLLSVRPDLEWSDDDDDWGDCICTPEYMADQFENVE